MKRVIYLACFLGLISALAGGVLALVNAQTADLINEHAIAAEKENLVKIYPNAKFTEIDFREDTGLIEKVFTADNGATIYKVKVYGYKDYISFLVAIHSGKIEGFTILSINDTPGYGMKLAEQSYADSITGTALDEPIDMVSGATRSSNAVKSGIQAAISHYQSQGGN